MNINPYESPLGMEAGESPLWLAVQVVLFPFGALFVLSWFMAFGFLAIAVYPVVAGGVLAPGPFESRWGFTLFSASSVLWGAVLFFAVKFIAEVALNHA